ncbi:MAG: glycosyltransferase [Lachnospiraceae bacterium]|nr:glycosyltransferase [Lachnospiraceae bacterium]
MNNINYKVSIITVVYNGAKTIEQTIQSVLQQSYKNIEYIIIDGLSTDGTQQIIEKYAQDLSYYVSEKDDGLYYAMNKGIERATGDIIGIINSDDWYDENAVKDIVECFRENDVELVYGKVAKISEEHRVRITRKEPLDRMWYGMPLSHPAVFVKKDVYDRLGGFDVNYRVASDYELLLRFYAGKVKFGYVDKVIAYFREGGITTKRTKENRTDVYKISMSYVDKCPYKEYALSQIKERYDWRGFEIAIKDAKEMLGNLLCDYFHETIKSIIIFGTGIWGEECYKALADGEVEILYFADNDAAKWDTEFYGIKVIAPSKLQDMDSYVLIAVKESGEEIKQQLVDNKKLKCVSIKELQTMYLNYF